MRVRVSGYIALLTACFYIVSCAPPARENGLATSAGTKSYNFANNLCSPEESVLFSCLLEDNQIASVCLATKSLSYRESQSKRKDRVQFSVSANTDWSNIHLGNVTGGGGGHENHIRFTTPDGDNIMAIEGAPGQYHDAARGSWSGITTVKADGSESGRRCQSNAAIASWDYMIDLAAPAGSAALIEEEGSKFDGWFIP